MDGAFLAATDGVAPGGVVVPHDFRCPITGELMEDPVVAEDGRSYERAQIRQWFAQCTTQGVPITSPFTREEIGPRLLSNHALKQSLAQLLELQQLPPTGAAEGPDGGPAGGPAEGTPGAVGSVHGLGEIFAQLDPLRELLAQCLDGWQPPALVVVGNEKSGKSSQLERLCMMPMFPHDEAICTRLPIQVRLRRGPPRAPRLEVFNEQTNQTEGEIIDVPMESADIDVRAAMDRLVELQNGAISGVSTTHAIILHIQSSSVPNLDLVDLPGVVVNPAVGEPDDMPQLTKDLVNTHIERHKAHSMFLCAVDATTAPNASTALQLLRDKGVLDKTIGVITMCDFALAPQQKTKVRERLAQTGDAVRLEPHGYVATVNTPVDGEGLTNMQRLERTAVAEPSWFARHGYQDKVQAGQATSAALLDRCNTMFIDYISRSWVPTTLDKLAAERQRLHEANTALGLPAAFGRARQATFTTPSWLDELRPAAADAVKAALQKEMPRLLDQFSHHMLSHFDTGDAWGAMDSHIVQDASHKQALGRWLVEEGQGGQLQLLYRASDHGWAAAQFHAHCNNQGPTLTVIRCTGGYIFGGYADQSWNSSNQYRASPKAFLFALHCHAGLGPTKMAQTGGGAAQNAMNNNAGYGPTFGANHDMHVANGANGTNGSYTNIGSVYQCPPGQTGNTFLTGARNFQAAEVEVFRLAPGVGVFGARYAAANNLGSEGISALEDVLPWSTTLPMTDESGTAGPVAEFLKHVQERVSAVCDAANTDEQLLGWLRTALEREDSPFKLSRFPQIIDAFVAAASRLLEPCREEFRAAVIGAGSCIAKHLDINGLSVKINHDWTARPITSTVHLDRERIIGAITEFYAPPRLRILQTGLQDCATSVLQETLNVDTEDDCNQRRLELLEKIRHIDAAADGIRAIIAPAAAPA